MDLADRVVGSALGLALGDALGAPFEFLRARNVPDPIPAFERPWLGEPPGSTTDDTAMARNLMRSLAARGGLDPADVLERHLAWFRSDPPDVGTLTGRVLRRIAAGEAPEAAAQAIWNERGPEVSAGNGSVMYCAPLGLAYANRPERAPRARPALSRPHARRRSLPDRGHRRHARRRGARPRRAQHPTPRARPSPPSRIWRAARSSSSSSRRSAVRARSTVRIRGSVCSRPARRFQALVRPGDAETELRRVVSLGGDADTNAAVAGALLGARDGMQGLPPAWLERLLDADAIRTEAEALVPLAETR